jgi:GDP-L-fucose synthase
MNPPGLELNVESRVFVAGHRGLVGSAIVRELERQGHKRILVRPRSELDLCDPEQVRAFYQTERPEFVFVAAARVGGIHANDTRPAEFLFENLQIQNHLIDGAWRAGVTKLLFLGSSCIYPKLAPQPLQEDCLLSGPLEPTNQWYAVAKIAGLKLCQAYRRQYRCRFICAMPTNLYGPNDNYDLQQSHVLPALIRKVHEAHTQQIPGVTCWGSGAALREFLHADDLARACVFLMRHYDAEAIINVGSGQEISIRDLAALVSRIVEYRGRIEWDASKPDGTPRKLLDSSRLFALGWRPQIGLEEGIRRTYEEFKSRQQACAAEPARSEA